MADKNTRLGINVVTTGVSGIKQVADGLRHQEQVNKDLADAVQGTNAAYKELDDRLREIAPAWRTANVNSRDLKTEYLRLQNDGLKPTSAQLQALSKEIEAAQKVEHELNTSLKETVTEMRATGEATESQTRYLDGLSKKVQGTDVYLTRYRESLEKVSVETRSTAQSTVALALPQKKYNEEITTGVSIQKLLKSGLKETATAVYSTKTAYDSLKKSQSAMGLEWADAEAKVRILRVALQQLKDAGVTPLNPSFKALSSQIEVGEKAVARLEVNLKDINTQLIKGKSELDAYDDGLKKAAITTEALEKSLLQEVSTVKTLDSTLKEHRATLDALESAMEAMRSRGVDPARGAFVALENQAKEVRGELARLQGELVDTSEEYQDVAVSVRQMDKGMHTNVNTMKVMRGSARAMRDDYVSLSDRVKDLNDGFVKMSAVGNLIADGIQDAARAMKDFVMDSSKAYLAYEDETRRVFAQIPDMSADMRENLSRDARIIANEIGYLPAEVLPTLRKAMNLGIGEDNVLASIKTASMAARIGGADLTETLVTGQSVVNAYGGELYDLSETYDLLNYITQNSNLEFSDLNASMNAIVSPAAEAGLSLEDVAAAMITMNKQGDEMGEIATLLGNLLPRLVVESSEAGTAFKSIAGTSFTDFIADNHSLVDAMQLVTEHSERTGKSVVSIFGGDSPFYADQQAARAIAELTGRHIGELGDAAEGTAGAIGTLSAASAEFAESDTLAVAQMVSAYESMKIEIGEAALSIATSVDLINNATLVAQNISGDIAGQVGNHVDASMNAAAATGDWVEQMDRLVTSSNEVTGVWWFNSVDKERAGLTELSAGIEETVLQMAELGMEHWEVRYAMQELDSEQQHLIPTFEEYQALLNETGDDAAYLAGMQRDAAARTAALGKEMVTMSDRHAFKDAIEGAREFLDVVQVLDGDTVKFNVAGEIQTLRFANIDTPEIAHGENGAMPFAVEAMERTQAYIDKHGLELGATLDRDSYGRIIGDVAGIEYDLVREGLAIALPVELSEDAEAAEMFQAAMLDAAEAGRGMFEDEALAARVLSGELVDLTAYYEELAESNTKTFADYRTAAGLLSDLEDAQRDVAEATANGGAASAEQAEAVILAQEAIRESLEETALAAFEAQLILSGDGALESYLALQVELGNVTQAYADQRIEMVYMTEQAELLGGSSEFLLLTSEQQAVALGLLTEGTVTTAEKAIILAQQYGDELIPSIDEADLATGFFQQTLENITREEWLAKFKTTGLKEAQIDAGATQVALKAAAGSYSATFTTTHRTVNEDAGSGSSSSSDSKGRDKERPKYASGVDMIVPPEFTNDSYLFYASAGERLQVTPAAEVGTTHPTQLPPIVMNFYGQTEPDAVYDAASDALEMARAIGRA